MRFIAPLLWAFAFQVIGFTIGQFTAANMDWYNTLDKSTVTPPAIAFPIAWGIIYTLLALCGWRIWSFASNHILKAIFGAVMVLNWGWSFIFFVGQEPGIGFAWIMILNIANLVFIKSTWSDHRLAALLMIPHLLWCLFASYLNYAIWVMN